MSPPARARVLYLGAVPLAALGVAGCLHRSGLDVGAVCEDAEAMVAAVAAQQPNLVIFGALQSPSQSHHAFALCREVTTRWARMCVILMRRDADDDLVQADAVYVGASACLLPTVTCDSLTEAVEDVLRGGVRFTCEQHQLAHAVERLTDRQLGVLRLCAADKTVREIASELGIGQSTVKTHQSEIRSVFGVHTTADAVERAQRRGLI